MSSLEETREELYSKQPPASQDKRAAMPPRRPQSTVPSTWEEPAQGPRLMDKFYLSKLHQRRMSIRTLIAFVILLLGVGVFIGYTVFFGRADIGLEVLGPDRITAGEPTTISVRITNRGSVPLRDGMLILTLPAGAAVFGQTAASLSPVRERVAVDDIPAGGEFIREFNIQFIGRDGDDAEISGVYSYRPENIQSKLTRQARFTPKIGRVPVSITIDAPERVSSGEEIKVTIGLDIEASVSLPEMWLGIEMPPGFVLSSATPSPVPETKNIWALGSLKSDTSTVITLRGVMSGEPEEPKSFAVRLGRYDPTSRSWLLLTEALGGPTIVSPLLLAHTTLGGNRSGALSLGDHIEGQVLIRNNLSQPVQNVTVGMSMPERFLELGSIRVKNGFYDATQRLIVWNPASSDLLSELAPGKDEALEFSFRLKSNPAIRGFSDKNFTFPVITTIDSGTPPPDARGLPLAYRDSVEFQIASNLTLAARSTYHDSPAVNTGPLPPKAGEATTYTIFLQLGSSVNDVRDVTLRAVLPGGVAFGRVIGADVGTLEFNGASREIAWRIGRLPAATGVLRPHATAVFVISLTPAENQVGSSPSLLASIGASGRDSFTGVELSATADDVTTELRTDPRSKSDEWVVTR